MNEIDITKKSLVEQLSKILTYDKTTNSLMINNSEDIPLNIIFNGPLHLKVNSDLEIESNGQLDLVTHGSKICLDSLDSQIYLNSRRTQYCLRLLDRFENANRQIIEDDKGEHRFKFDKITFNVLLDKIMELENKLNDLTKGIICQE